MKQTRFEYFWLLFGPTGFISPYTGLVQSLSDKGYSCSWTVSSLKVSWEIRALWIAIIVAAQMLCKNNEIYFLMLRSYVITFLNCHWRYPHIKFRHWRKTSVHDSYIPSSSFLIIFYQALTYVYLLCWHKPPLLDKSSFLLINIIVLLPLF
jgi:hypothetical protein